jgi:hypothetical protein
MGDHGGVTGYDLYETPGEALLLLSGLGLFAVGFPLGFVLFVAGASAVALLPVVLLVQVGALLEFRVETRIARRRHPELRGRQRLFGVGEKQVRRELLQAASLRSAARWVTADPRTALGSIPHDRQWWKGTMLLAVPGTALAVALLFSAGGTRS